MEFPGTWMTPDEKLVYRVVPKCACSSIGQILHYSAFGRFYDGDIHDPETGLHKWALEDSKVPIINRVRSHTTYTFTFVRNPYTRVLSAFFDKICGIQLSGGRYRGNALAQIVASYGIDVGGPEGQDDFDQISSFRRFLLLARDSVLWERPLPPDIHWASISGHVSTLIVGGGRFDAIHRTERFEEGMRSVLDAVETAHRVNLARVPRFNESADHGPRRAHPVEDYFDDLSLHLMRELYQNDFDLFGYDMDDPSNLDPIREIDLDAVHAELSK